jgi:hypothetical protein
MTVDLDYKRLYEEQAAICAQKEALIAELRKENHRLRLREVPLSDWGHEYLANLKCKVKSLSERVRVFETGEKYTSMQADFKNQLAGKDKDIRWLMSELADANARTVTVRENWLGVIADMEKEHVKELKAKDSRIKVLGDRLLEVERHRDEAKGKLLIKTQEMYAALTELEEERGRNRKLAAQINRDYESSSIPSSMKPNRKKIANSREKTGKDPGGQPGHKGHGRKKREPTNTVSIPAPMEYVYNPDYIPTGRIITRQLVNVSVNVIVDEFSTPEFINVRTRERVHADFPDGVVNEVNYGGSVKAFAYLLNSHCNVSIENVSGFLSDLTGGDLMISAGMINNLTKEFSMKTADEQCKAFGDIQLSPAMGVDYTEANVNGKKAYVLVNATEAGVMFFAKWHKGHKGVEGSPAADYQMTLIHDHDTTFYKYGRAHQECLQHVLRYLLDSMNNEAGLEWNQQMRELIREMIHFRKGLPDDGKNPDETDPDKVNEFEKRYDKILELAEKEYGYEPPSKYYMEGFNLYRRLRKYRGNHLLFLHDRRVPWTNNQSERALRKFKRKQKQAMVFRSFESLDYLCQCMGVIETMRVRGENLFESISAIFNRTVSKDAAAA